MPATLTPCSPFCSSRRSRRTRGGRAARPRRRTLPSPARGWTGGSRRTRRRASPPSPSPSLPPPLVPLLRRRRREKKVYNLFSPRLPYQIKFFIFRSAHLYLSFHISRFQYFVSNLRFLSSNRFLYSIFRSRARTCFQFFYSSL